MSIPKSPSHEPVPWIQDTSSPLLLLFYSTRSGPIPSQGSRSGPHGPLRVPDPHSSRAPARPAPGVRAARRARVCDPRPVGTALSCPSQSTELGVGGRSLRPQQSINWSAQPSLTRSRPVPAFLLFRHPPFQKKRRLGHGGRQRHTGSGGTRSRGGKEGLQGGGG